MPIVCGIRFRGTLKTYYFASGELTDLAPDDYVIVETARGQEMARVVAAPHEVPASEVVGELKPVLRRASSLDLLEAERFRQREDEATRLCREQVARLNLPMKISGAEYSYDGSRLVFFFTSEERVDFRHLVRELAHLFKTRIELRQIGVRDEAKIVGGVGKCGRPLCCATWLADFSPVSIRMAKAQNLPLSPMEISGLCGRLLCCLTYEQDYYQEIKGRFPKVGKMVDTPLGPAKVVRVSVLQETVTLLTEDGNTVELTADQLSGKEPINNGSDSRDQRRALGDRVGQAVSATLERPRSRPSGSETEASEVKPVASAPTAHARQPRRQDAGAAPATPEQAPSHSRSARRRRGRNSGAPVQAPAARAAERREAEEAPSATAREEGENARSRRSRNRRPRQRPAEQAARPNADEARRESAQDERGESRRARSSRSRRSSPPPRE